MRHLTIPIARFGAGRLLACQLLLAAFLAVLLFVLQFDWQQQFGLLVLNLLFVVVASAAVVWLCVESHLSGLKSDVRNLPRRGGTAKTSADSMSKGSSSANFLAALAEVPMDEQQSGSGSEFPASPHQ